MRKIADPHGEWKFSNSAKSLQSALRAVNWGRTAVLQQNPSEED
jgi:hypothetical protein